MHRSRTAITVLALTAAVAGCGAQHAAPAGTVAALGAATTPATTTSPARTPAAAQSTLASPAPLSTTRIVPVVATSGAAPATATGRPSPDATVTIADGTVLPHFDTPEAAMRYLAAAWNSYDETALRHVTQGQARRLLLGMRGQAVNLRLNHCDLRSGGNGDYLCHFDHDYPAAYPAKLREGTHGTAEFIAAPSASVGWYMFAYEGCG